jgi:hypothetical protein
VLSQTNAGAGAYDNHKGEHGSHGELSSNQTNASVQRTLSSIRPLHALDRAGRREGTDSASRDHEGAEEFRHDSVCGRQSRATAPVKPPPTRGKGTKGIKGIKGWWVSPRRRAPAQGAALGGVGGCVPNPRLPFGSAVAPGVTTSGPLKAPLRFALSGHPEVSGKVQGARPSRSYGRRWGL